MGTVHCVDIETDKVLCKYSPFPRFSLAADNIDVFFLFMSKKINAQFGFYFNLFILMKNVNLTRRAKVN